MAAKVFKGTVSGIAGGTAAALMRGGRVVVQQLAVDSFSQALANTIVEATIPKPVLGDGLKFDVEKFDTFANRTISGDSVPRARLGSLVADDEYVTLSASSVKSDLEKLTDLFYPTSERPAIDWGSGVKVAAGPGSESATFRAAMNWLDRERHEGKQYYTDSVNEAKSSASKFGWSAGRALNQAFFDVLTAPVGAYGMVMDAAFRERLIDGVSSGLEVLLEDPVGVAEAGGRAVQRYATETNAGDIAEDALRLVSGGLGAGVLGKGVTVATKSVVRMGARGFEGAGAAGGRSVGAAANELGGIVSVNGAPRRVPLGFESEEQFMAAARELQEALKRSGINDGVVGVRGSSVLGYSQRKGTPFGPQSDIDFFVESAKLTADYKSSKNIPGFVIPQKILPDYPELKAWSVNWGEILNRKITPGAFVPGSVPNEAMIVFRRFRQ